MVDNFEKNNKNTSVVYSTCVLRVFVRLLAPSSKFDEPPAAQSHTFRV
jgi:hypothetical protein